MTNAIIEQGTYNYLKGLDVADRSPKQQDDIDAYEASHNIGEEKESSEVNPMPTNDAVAAPVVAQDEQELTPLNDDVPEDEQGSDDNTTQSEAWTVDVVAVDQNIVEQFEDAYKVVENQLPEFNDEKMKKLFVLAAKATCLTKWTGAFTLRMRTVDHETLPQRMAHTFGLLSFDYFRSKSLINKAMKDAQIGTKYLTICTVPEEAQRDTTVKGYEDALLGCQFIAHWNTIKRDETDYSIIGQFEHVFKDEGVKNDDYHILTTSIMGVRYTQQVWLEKNKEHVQDLIEKIQATRPAQVKAETFKLWSGILVLASLWNKDTYNEMVQLMLEMVGTVPLEGKYKLACALSVVVPDMESFLSRYSNNSDMKLSSTMIGGLLKSVGFTEDLSVCFQQIGLAMNSHKSGYTIQLLKETYTPLLKFEDVRIQNYLKNLKRPKAVNAPEQLVA
ncbi:hypothetical protein V6C59_20055 [Acinetobacter bereziniae]|uniref:hypothetical protein n=1 Tax=Acinetobacter bereziniae TaxID=106648 RepID=UPI002FDA0A5B